VDVLVKAGFEGLCANRSGLGLNVDLIVRIDVYAMAGLDNCGAFCCRRHRADEGRRNDGGRKPQLRGAFGGIVVVRALMLALTIGSHDVHHGTFSGFAELGPQHARVISFTIVGRALRLIPHWRILQREKATTRRVEVFKRNWSTLRCRTSDYLLYIIVCTWQAH
jgi:hypothetical protein